MNDEVAMLRAALERIQKIQPEMVETFRKHGIVFDGPLGSDPSNWEHVAFSIYTRLCEAESIASGALAESNWCYRPVSEPGDNAVAATRTAPKGAARLRVDAADPGSLTRLADQNWCKRPKGA